MSFVKLQDWSSDKWFLSVCHPEWRLPINACGMIIIALFVFSYFTNILLATLCKWSCLTVSQGKWKPPKSQGKINVLRRKKKTKTSWFVVEPTDESVYFPLTDFCLQLLCSWHLTIPAGRTLEEPRSPHKPLTQTLHRGADADTWIVIPLDCDLVMMLSGAALAQC